MIEECSESGLSRREIAKNHGLNESTIRGWEEEIDILNNNITEWSDEESDLSPKRIKL